jgi:hypothetical protein
MDLFIGADKGEISHLTSLPEILCKNQNDKEKKMYKVLIIKIKSLEKFLLFRTP